MIGKAFMLDVETLIAVIHAAGQVAVLRAVVLLETSPRLTPHFWSILWLFIWVPLPLVVIHLLEIGHWGMFHWVATLFPDAGASLYFSGSSYTTLGYGDLVLSAEWRFFGSLAALTGIPSSRLSVGCFVTVVGAVYEPAIVQGSICPRVSRR